SATTDLYYIHADHLGTPRKITRPNDNRVVWSWESEAFGNSLPDQNPSGLGDFVFNLRFPGQYYDQETGVFYNYFRDYDPKTGRYIESDPIGLKGGINTYAYVGGSPVNLVDPTGESPGTDKICKLIKLPICKIKLIWDGCKWVYTKLAGSADDATTGETPVIGRTKDLKNLNPGEKSLLDRLPDQGNPKANWEQNSSVLRQEMANNRPIRDASPGDTSGPFLNAERNLLSDRGWTFDPQTNYWVPPK
ncbi:MAG: RHS repeat-associated core domain-containing protein, partial [Methylobacter sp.]